MATVKDFGLKNSLETFSDSNGIKFIPGILNNNEDIIPSFYFKLEIKS